MLRKQFPSTRPLVCQTHLTILLDFKIQVRRSGLNVQVLSWNVHTEISFVVAAFETENTNGTTRRGALIVISVVRSSEAIMPI